MSYNLPFKIGDKVIELGGGAAPLVRPNYDIRPMPTVDEVINLDETLPFKDNELDGVFCKYALEHVSWRKVPFLISETARILKPGGIAVFIIPNTRAQMLWAISQESWNEKISQCLFGDQDYPDNTHRAAFSPDYVIQLFRKYEFSDVIILPHGELKTDMIVEAKKKMNTADNWTRKEREIAYNKDYFDGGRGPVGGYSREGYWDYPIHWFTAREIVSRSPDSVLELGAARGYVLKRIEDCGIKVKGLDISKHCIDTRVIKDITQWDITEAPWPIPDNSFDLCVSTAVLEHIPEHKLDVIIKEINRTCRRALHGISFEDDNFDKTHVTLKPHSWWRQKFPINHEIVDKETLEKGPANPPLGIGDNSIKLNIGSFTTMFYHGWINIDIHPLQKWAESFGFKFLQHDMRTTLPFADNSVDLIYTCHFLEHINYVEGLAFLKECHRVMKPDSIIRIIMPDAKKLISEYMNSSLNHDELNDGCSKSDSQIGKLWSLLFPGHQSIYDKETAAQYLKKAGFDKIYDSEFRESKSTKLLIETLDLLPTISMYIEARKN